MAILSGKNLIVEVEEESLRKTLIASLTDKYLINEEKLAKIKLGRRDRGWK